jgi:AcrR family transcriptional regulator
LSAADDIPRRRGRKPASPWEGRPRASDQTFAERKLAVLQHAAKMFCQRGYHETSFDDLAHELSVSKPTVYYYIESKQKCLAEVARLGQEGALFALRQAHDLEEGTGLDRLSSFYRQYIDIMTSDFGKCIAIARKHLSGDELKEIKERIDLADRILRSIFQGAIEDGSIGVNNPLVDYELVLGSLHWISEWYRPGGAISQRELADAHIASLKKLLKPNN